MSLLAAGLLLLCAPAGMRTARGQPQPSPSPAPATATGAADAAASPDEAAVAPDEEILDINALRQEYLRLRDQLFRSRARAAAVASTLYSTKLKVELAYESGRHYTVTRASIRLDGANIFDDTSGAIANDRNPRFEGFVAPGRHVLSFRIEATGKDDERFTTVTENTVVIQAPNGKDVEVSARAKDDGDIAYAWQREEKGSFALRLDIKVRSIKRAGSTKKQASAGQTLEIKTARREDGHGRKAQ